MPLGERKRACFNSSGRSKAKVNTPRVGHKDSDNDFAENEKRKILKLSKQ